MRTSTPACGRGLTLIVASFGLLIGGGENPQARERLAGPVEAAVIRIVDGDTIEVRARVWLGEELTVMARLRGIDAPELKGHCRQERAMAAAATERLTAAAGVGAVRLSNIENDKFGGRVLADIATPSGEQLATLMLASGLVRAYDGGKRGGWCFFSGMQ